MKKTTLIHSLGVLLFTIFASCDGGEQQITPSKDQAGMVTKSVLADAKTTFDGTGTLYGSAVNFNGAPVRSFVTLERYRPTAIGYEMSNQAFNNLPNPGTPENTEFLIPLPTLPSTPPCYDGIHCPDWLPNLGILFDHLTLHWYPLGSEPAGIFSFPKFDFHCYTISLTERMAIIDSDPAIMVAPDQIYMPSNYYGPIGPMSMMGSHWVDLLSPEFNGGMFTKTFIYGTFNAKTVFEEISVTRDYLLSNALIEDVVSIRQPISYQRDGFYPMKYRISKNDLRTRIFLSDFLLYRVSGESEF
jgi:hypothetical protein